VYESFVTLYRVFCQPRAFAAEAWGWRTWGRVGFMLRMIPAMVMAQTAMVAVVALAGEPLLGPINLIPWVWQGVLGLLIGMMWATAWSVLGGVVWGMLWAPVTWVVGCAALPLIPGVPQGLAPALQTGIPLGYVFGVALGLVARSARGALWGLALGLVFGVIVGAEGRVGGLVELLSRFLIGYSGVFIVLIGFEIGYFRAEWYPIDAAATLWQLARARRRPSEARELFRRSPIYWREPIWLPLAGLKSFLHEIDEQSPEAAVEECFFVMLERPTQARWAQAALMEISNRHMAEPNTVAEIAAVADQIGKGKMAALRSGGERSGLPAHLAKVVPAFEGLARHAEQHMAATLPYIRRRALERLREGAERLAGELAMTGGAFAGMWARTARKWGQVAAARLAELGEEEVAGHIHNPFVFGQPIEETETNLFVGRRGVVREIEVSLLGAAQKPALVLWGPRRMGKTSVLLQLPRLLGEEFVPAFVDMQAMQVRESVVAFFRSVSAAAAAGMRRRGLEMEALEASDLEGSPYSAFADWMEGAEERLGEGRHLLLCLDEFERLERSIREGKLPEELMDQIRHMIQHRARVVLLFAGSHRPDEMELNWPDALISTRTIRVSYLSEDEARQVITEPVPDFEVSYEPGSVERIVEVTRCQPNLVQAVCYELVNHLNVEGRRGARREDVDAAVGQALESAHLYFAEMWRQVNEGQRGLLAKMAEAPAGATAEGLAAATGAGREEVAADLKALERQSIAEVVDERWRFQVPMVGEWVRRRGG
jgi:hypothetical protein